MDSTHLNLKLWLFSCAAILYSGPCSFFYVQKSQGQTHKLNWINLNNNSICLFVCGLTKPNRIQPISKPNQTCSKSHLSLWSEKYASAAQLLYRHVLVCKDFKPIDLLVVCLSWIGSCIKLAYKRLPDKYNTAAYQNRTNWEYLSIWGLLWESGAAPVAAAASGCGGGNISTTVAAAPRPALHGSAAAISDILLWPIVPD